MDAGKGWRVYGTKPGYFEIEAVNLAHCYHFIEQEGKMVEDSITVTVCGKENVEWIRDKVRDGHFASEADLVTQSVSLLREDDSEFEIWMREVVAQRYDSHKSDPSSAISIDEVLRNLEERRTKRAEQAR